MHNQEKITPNLKPKTSRSAWIDYSRGIAIILIVYMHIANGFLSLNIDFNKSLYKTFGLFYYARMPLFFIISGIYIRNSYNKRGLKGFTNYKFSTILYPYFIWGFIQLTFQIIAYQKGLSNTPRQFSDYLFLFYNPHGIDQFWFLFVLFSVSVIFGLLQYYFKIRPVYFLFIGLLTYILFYYLPAPFYLFGIKTICKFLFYIALGDVLSTTLLNPKNESLLTSFKLCFAFWTCFILIKLFMHYADIEEYEVHFFSFQNLILLVSIGLGLGLLITTSFVLQRFNALGFLRIIGKHSLYIYTMHIIFNGILRAVLLRTALNHYPDAMITVVTIASILLSIVCYKILVKTGLSFFYTPPSRAKVQKLVL